MLLCWQRERDKSHGRQMEANDHKLRENERQPAETKRNGCQQRQTKGRRRCQNRDESAGRRENPSRAESKATGDANESREYNINISSSRPDLANFINRSWNQKVQATPTNQESVSAPLKFPLCHWSRKVITARPPHSRYHLEMQNVIPACRALRAFNMRCYDVHALILFTRSSRKLGDRSNDDMHIVTAQ